MGREEGREGEGGSGRREGREGGKEGRRGVYNICSNPGVRMDHVAIKWYQLETTAVYLYGSSTQTSRYIIILIPLPRVPCRLTPFQTAGSLAFKLLGV